MAKHSTSVGRPVRGDIQGLRTIAVGGVVVNHAQAAWLPGGYVGVDIFFVISGFLITGQLDRRLRRPEGAAFVAFYALRIRRLLPASFVVLIATIVASRLLLTPLDFVDVARDGVATSLYAVNLLFAHDDLNYLASSSPSVFQHYWSLAVEEQFYLFWPVLLLVLHRLAGRWRVALLALLAACSLALCVYMTGYRQPWAFFLLPTRAWEFAAGGLLALMASRFGSLTPRLRLLTGLAGLLAILWSFVEFNERTHFPGYIAVVPVLGTAALIAAGTAQPVPYVGAILSSRPFQWVGDRSYSLYLWHWPLLVIPAERWELDTADHLGLLAVAVVLSDVSYRLVEQPFRRSSSSRSSNVRAFGTGIGATVVAVACIAGLWNAVGSLDAGKRAPDVPMAMAVRELAAPQYVPSDLRPSLRAAMDDSPRPYGDGCHADFLSDTAKRCVYGSGGGPRIALLGDSHATHWFPGLERIVEERDGTLLSATKSSCPSVDVSVYNGSLGRDYTECDRWRKSVNDLLEDFRPDIVVLSNHGPGYRKSLGAQALEKWAEGVTATTRSLVGAGVDVVVLEDIPRWQRAVNYCLSANLDDPAACSKPRSALLDSEFNASEQQASEAAGGRFLSTEDWFCSQVCQGIVGNVLVYRDQTHMTSVYSIALAPELGVALLD